MENIKEIEKITREIARQCKKIFELSERCKSIKITKEGDFISVGLEIASSK